MRSGAQQLVEPALSPQTVVLWESSRGNPNNNNIKNNKVTFDNDFKCTFFINQNLKPWRLGLDQRLKYYK